MTRRPILTAAEMRAAEEAAIAAGTSVAELMERAGRAAAEAIWRYAGPLPALVLCGPGNNGGDGRVIARELRARGVAVREAGLDSLDVAPAPLLIDALFGTGLSRPVAQAQKLLGLAAAARVRVAIDLPSGVATDDGAILSPVPDCDLTVTFQTLKPSHWLQPAARRMGRIVVADIGIPVSGSLVEIGPAPPREPGPDDHKYSRGYVAVLAGEMPGAAALAAAAALKAGAGYVRLIGPSLAGLPHAIVQGPGDPATLLADERIGAVLVGPGLGRDRRLLDLAIASGRPLVLDADGLRACAGAILTPHAGEFARLFPGLAGSKVEQARAAAAASGAVIVFKGPDTVVAAPDGRAAIAPPAPAWLATAGTGDVLAGIAAARCAALADPFEAACSAVFLHNHAAWARPGRSADELVENL